MNFPRLVLNTAIRSRVSWLPTVASLRHYSAPRFRINDARLLRVDDEKYSAIHLRLEGKDDPLKIPLVWFRDHCRSPAMYNHQTNQRRFDGTGFFQRALLADDRNPVEFDFGKQTLTIHWRDGHESVFLAEEISNWAIFTLKAYDECASRTLWDNQTLKAIPSVSSKSFDFAVFSRLLVRFGVVAVLGVDHRNEKATRKLCESVAPIQNTFFGDFWVFGADTEHKTSEAREDTAYGSDEIGPHTDGTYFDQTPGIQVFHCLKPAEEGGDTVLVDGFSAIESLRTQHPEHFDLLSRMTVEHHYIEGGFQEPKENVDPEEDVPPAPKHDANKQSLYARSIINPVVTLFKQKTVQIRYNPYDRAPLRSLYPESGSGSLEKTVKFYEAYENLSRLINDPNSALNIKLLPGTVLFIDNYRVLHGRTAYKGSRRMCGCYLSRDNLLAKARPLLSATFHDV